MLKRTLLLITLLCTGNVLLYGDDNSTVTISGDQALGSLEYTIGHDQVDDVNMDGVTDIQDIIISAWDLPTGMYESSTEESHQMIDSDELQKMSNLRDKMIQSNLLKGQHVLTKIPQSLEDVTMASGLKEYKQSLAQKNKLMGKIQLQSKVDEVRSVRLPSLGNADRDCSDCEHDFTPYGSECCDSAWDEFGINCADLEGNYNWDCSGCACPGDEAGECGDGNCNINEDCETCEADCGVCGECDAGYIADCADNDCCPESWIGDGFADCEDQAYGCDLTCYEGETECDDSGGQIGRAHV